MKLMTILGTRPEIIRLSRVITGLDECCEHVLVHTGQNYDPNLNNIFFEQLRVRKPDHYLQARGTFGEQIASILSGCEKILNQVKPEKLLILGDTNSSLSAIIAKRMGIPVFHMEAGNRCYDDRVPEEVNRRIIDHSSTILMPYTQRSKENLVREGISNNRIYVTGNPIKEVLDYYQNEINDSAIHQKLGVEKGKFFLMTLHRAENVDIEERLVSFTKALDSIQKEYDLPVVCSIHPRTLNKLQKFGIVNNNKQIKFMEPLGLFDFVALEKTAYCVLSDSGTVQEECCIFQVPTVTLRDVTERPETIDCGSNMLSGAGENDILRCTSVVTSRPAKWLPPQEYLQENVSDTIIKIVLGYQHQK